MKYTIYTKEFPTLLSFTQVAYLYRENYGNICSVILSKSFNHTIEIALKASLMLKFSLGSILCQTGVNIGLLSCLVTTFIVNIFKRFMLFETIAWWNSSFVSQATCTTGLWFSNSTGMCGSYAFNFFNRKPKKALVSFIVASNHKYDETKWTLSSLVLRTNESLYSKSGADSV